jgi:23S rRNA (cytidine2498-2'-O)-methyltransferase
VRLVPKILPTDISGCFLVGAKPPGADRTAVPGGAHVLLCRPGFEVECHAESQSASAPPTPGSGWVLVEGPVLSVARPFRSLVFARDRFAGEAFAILDPTDRVGPLLSLAAAYGPVGTLWLQHADSTEGRSLAKLCQRLQGRMEGGLRSAGLISPGSRRRLHVMFLDGRSGFIGVSEADDGALWSMGVPRLRLAGAPSRSAAKLEEGLLWFLGETAGSLLASGMSAVDLGAAPGGWTWVLARRGLRVTAVDHGKLAREAEEAGAVRHLSADAFTYRPPRPVDWMVCDVVDKPARTAELVQRWLGQGWCRRTIFNLKLPMKQRLAEVERILARLRTIPGLRLQARQLYHDREEITVFAARS